MFIRPHKNPRNRQFHYLLDNPNFRRSWHFLSFSRLTGRVAMLVDKKSLSVGGPRGWILGVYSLDCGSQSSVKFRYGSFSGRDYRLLGLWRPGYIAILTVMIGEKVRGVGYAGRPDNGFRSLWASLAILTLWASFSGRAEREIPKSGRFGKNWKCK